MPRKTRRQPAPAAGIDEIKDRVMGAGWKRVGGYDVKRSIKEDRRYLCPYCNGPIQPGLVHVVAYPEGRLDERRHYHSPCWEKFIKSESR